MSDPQPAERVSDDLARYARQVRYAPLNEEGQRRLLASRVLICGCGALGTVAANTLVRAGVGHVRVVDRDFIELNNLQRQMLFDEDDLRADLPKAVAAATKLRKINSTVEIEPIVADVDYTNIESLAEGVDCIVDGTDNFETRFLINDASLKLGVPWVYGGCLGAEGQTMTIVPGVTACLRCLIPEPPDTGAAPTCDTAGILAAIIGVIASYEAMEAIKILSGNRQDVSRVLTVIDMWENRVRQVKLDGLRESSDCPACRGEYPWLTGARRSSSAVLCGRNAVQLTPSAAQRLSLPALADKLAKAGRVSHNAFLLRLAVDDYLLTIFPDGRAIIGGTEDVATARSVYARYIGS